MIFFSISLLRHKYPESARYLMNLTNNFLDTIIKIIFEYNINHQTNNNTSLLFTDIVNSL